MFFSVSLGFLAFFVFPPSFYLLEGVGDFTGFPILCELTGVEFIWELGLTTLVRTGVEALAMFKSGLMR